VGQAKSGTGWREVYLGGSQDAENKIFADLAEQVRAVQVLNKEHAGADRPLRGQHSKIHAGITNAEFRVSRTLPSDFKAGFFQPGKVYSATVRFSNADGLNRPDAELDLRGIALRLAFENRKPHDFLFVNAPVSHIRDAVEFMIVTTALARKGLMPTLAGDVADFVAHVQEIAGKLQDHGATGFVDRLKTQFQSQFNALRMLTILGGQVIRSAGIKSMATQDFWGRPPIKLGPLAVQLKLQHTTRERLRPEPSGPGLLRDDLQKRLAKGPIVYDFKVQRFVDEESTPIEDSSKEWAEEDSPFVSVAQLVIPQQNLGTKEAKARDAQVDALNFSPWNNITDDFLRPLGGMNRGRLLGYKASAEFRVQTNAGGRPAKSSAARANSQRSVT
jgi:catalase